MVHAVIAFLFLLLGLTLRNGTLIACAAPFAAYLAVTWLRPARPPAIDLELSCSTTRIARGQSLTIELRLLNREPRTQALLVSSPIDQTEPVPAGTPLHAVILAAGNEETFERRLHPARGRYDLASVTVYTTGFGYASLTSTTVSAVHRRTLIVQPELRAVPPLPIRPRRTLLYHGPVHSGTSGEGVDFFDVRELQEGASPHRLNWRAAARTDEALFVTTFERERIADVLIVVDGRRARNSSVGTRTLFEHSIDAAASVSAAMLRAGHRVGAAVIGAGIQWIVPGYGRRRITRVLDELARAREGDNAALDAIDAIPRAIMPTGSQVIVISPLAAEDVPALAILRARGHAVVLLSPNPFSYSQEGANPDRSAAPKAPGPTPRDVAVRIATLERNAVLRAVERTGITALDWNVHEPLRRCIERHLPPLRRAQNRSRTQ